jgi:hypothetical protein
MRTTLDVNGCGSGDRSTIGSGGLNTGQRGMAGGGGGGAVAPGLVGLDALLFGFGMAVKKFKSSVLLAMVALVYLGGESRNDHLK